MSIIFDESELLSFLDSAEEIPSYENLLQKAPPGESGLTGNEKLLLSLYRQLSADQQRKVLSHIRHVLESVHSVKKVNLLKAIEDSKHVAANENLSDIIKDIVK